MMSNAVVQEPKRNGVAFAQAKGMFRPIRIRTGSANFCPHNMPQQFVKNTPCPVSFQ